MALSPTEESLVRQLIAQNPALLNLASSESTIISKLGATKVSLSDLSAATSLSDADLALVRQGLNDKSFAMSVLSDYVNGKLPAASETVAGIIEIATSAEAQAFTANKAIDGAKLGIVLNSMLLGVNQTWQNLTASRSLATIYTNTTGKPIYVSAYCHSALGEGLSLEIDGITVQLSDAGDNMIYSFHVSGVVPPGSTYMVMAITTGAVLSGFYELR